MIISRGDDYYYYYPDLAPLSGGVSPLSSLLTPDFLELCNTVCALLETTRDDTCTPL